MTSASEAVKRLQSESLQQKSLNQLKQDAAELGLSKEDVKQFGNLTHKQTWLAAVENAVATKGNVIAPSEEMAIAQSQDIAVQRNEETFLECPACDGRGGFATEFDGSGWEVCNWCHGKTVVSEQVLEDWEDLMEALNKKEQSLEPTHVLIDGEWVAKADIVDLSQLPTLKQTDERFTDWEPWMIPGAVFSNALGRYGILYFDKWGNCHCKELDTEREWWACYRISSLTGLSTPSTPVEPFTPSGELPPKLTELTQPIDVKENLLRRMAEHGTPPEEIEKLRHEPLDYCTAYLGEFLLTLADSFQELTA